MAQQRPTIEFEDVPLDEARRMSRGPRMNRELYHALKQKIPSLEYTTTCMTILDGTNPAPMKHRILRVDRGLNVPDRQNSRQRPALLALH